jgi:myosin-1
MVRMGDVNEATILHNLRMRFSEDQIHTSIGTILVLLNPFKYFPHVYTKELIQEHLNLPAGEVAKPHIYGIAAAAFKGLRERRNQAIIISGESGAGKTEATKKCLEFFANATTSVIEGLQDRLIAGNPVLESFGNAKTLRNNNSSRFGKWMEVHFNSRSMICGCSIINYLLEKSRVAWQQKGERNFHIFYMVAAATPPDIRAKLSLAGPEAYNYINKSGCLTVEGMPDHELMDEILHAFKLVGFTKEEEFDLFNVVAMLLHLSNCNIVAVNDDKAEMDKSAATKSAIDIAAKLLGADPATLKKSLENKLIEARGERLWSPLNERQATDARNSMAKAIYSKMFDWLIQRVNESMVGAINTSVNIIGCLDIFGFEIFENNSFEQLCINYCNEKCVAPLLALRRLPAARARRQPPPLSRRARPRALSLPLLSHTRLPSPAAPQAAAALQHLRLQDGGEVLPERADRLLGDQVHRQPGRARPHRDPAQRPAAQARRRVQGAQGLRPVLRRKVHQVLRRQHPLQGAADRQDPRHDGPARAA